MFNFQIPKRCIRRIATSLDGIHWVYQSYTRNFLTYIQEEETDIPDGMVSKFHTKYVSENVRYMYWIIEPITGIFDINFSEYFKSHKSYFNISNGDETYTLEDIVEILSRYEVLGYQGDTIFYKDNINYKLEIFLYNGELISEDDMHNIMELIKVKLSLFKR